MSWAPTNISGICQQYPSLTTCQPSVLAFMAFVLQNLNQTYDKNYSDYKNKSVEDEYDFIIVGGGTAGCVLANRLSEIQEWKVLLLEAGDEEPLAADVPGFYGYLSGSSIDWSYQTQPEPYTCNDIESKTCFFSRGKVLGGSSTINAMIYTRGNPEDFNYWESLGNSGWSYQDVLPYFLKSEDNKLYRNSTFHHAGGYLTIDQYPYVHNYSNVIIDAWKDLGFEEVDYNSNKQLGVAKQQSANVNGARLSMNGAFIRPIRGRRPNLAIKVNALVTKILIDPETNRALGVEYSVSGDKHNSKRVLAKKEVILSAGTIESPKLLMLSGIGHKEELEKLGIDVFQILPVGDNLQDHVFLESTIGIWNDVKTENFDASVMQNDLVYWQSTHTGALSNLGIVPAMLFDKVLNQENNSVPDIQYFHMTPMIKDINLTDSYYGVPTYIPTAYNDGIGVGPILLHPKDRGTIRLNEKNPVWSQPDIRFNHLMHKEDRDTMIAACLKIKNLFDTRSFRKYGIKFMKPAKLCEKFDFESRKYYECLVEKYSKPSYHAVGTCKMGPVNDTSAVVNSKLQVLGIEGLRVIDASIMPSLPSGNSFAATVMIAEKGSDLVKDYWMKK